MEYRRSFVLEGLNSDRKEKIIQALQAKGFSLNYKEGTIVACRGKKWAKLFSFDITKYKTVAEISFNQIEGQKEKVVFNYQIDTRFALPTPNDERLLDAEVADILKVINTSSTVEVTGEREVTGIIAPTKMGRRATILSLVSLFVVPYLGVIGAVMGVTGLVISIKEKSGKKAIAWNAAAIFIGLSAYILNLLIKKALKH